MLMTCALHVRQYDKAWEMGADISVVDLEDSVPEPRKEEARRLALPLLRERSPEGLVQAVRINSLASPDGLRDLLALLDGGARPDALFVPKVDTARDLHILADILGERLASTFFLVLIETAAGLCAVEEIAAMPRVRALVFGAADYSTELGIPMLWDPLFYARSRIVVAATRAGIPAMDTPYFAIKDMEGLGEENARSRALGFRGRAAVHPGQIQAINAAYGPPPEEVDRARRVVALAERSGGQIGVLDDGQMIGPPMCLAARRTLALADKIDRVSRRLRAAPEPVKV
ncbi:MAG TPA: CoA ester lyase [Acidobacteria bacterium]|nr:CoA ester lyase [Acidobacteriota bacterium]